MKLERLSKSDLIDLLGASLGQEKARDAVDQQLKRMGRESATDFDKEQALALLDVLSREPGLVGVVARFAKVRLILQFK